MSVSKNKTFNISVDFGWKDFIVILQIILLILKLCGAITWSWWVVLLPTLVPVGGIVCAFIVLLVLALVSPDFRRFIHNYNADREDDKARTIINAKQDVEIEINGAEDENSDTSR